MQCAAVSTSPECTKDAPHTYRLISSPAILLFLSSAHMCGHSPNCVGPVVWEP